MAIYKRGKVYWFSFWFHGQRVQRSTKQGNPRVARTMEAAFRTALAKNEVGIAGRKPAPTLKDFAQRFMEHVQVRCAAKPLTVEFYAQKMSRLLEYEPLASAQLDAIDEALIDSYVQQRREKVAPASVNRDLATLRKGLRLAQEWRLIDRVPRIRMLPGERVREFVLSREREKMYLEMASQPLHDLAVLILDTGLRVGEALALEWRDVRLEAVPDAPHGLIHVRDGKTRNAKRTLPLTARAKAMLEARQRGARAAWVFTDESGVGPLSRFTVRDQHDTLRMALRLPADAVVHSLRHTMLTRLGEAGVDAFTIMRIAGHSTITVSQKYVHPSREAIGLAIQRLEAANRGLTESLPEGEKRRLLATNSATLSQGTIDVSQQAV